VFEEVTDRPSRWRIFWPGVDDREGALLAIQLGYWAMFVLAAVNLVTCVISRNYAGVVAAGFFTLLGVGVRLRWRVAAAVGLLIYTAALIYSVSHGSGIGVLTVFIFVGMLNGVRGTFAYAKHGRAAQGSGVTAVEP